MLRRSLLCLNAVAALPLLTLIVLGYAVLDPPALRAATTYKGYRIAHLGQIDTDLQFSEFFAGAHTISAWVMPEFTYNHKGPIFSVNGTGSFFVGQGDYRTGNGGYKKAGDPVLRIVVNGKEAKYLAPGYQRRKWNHIAVTRAQLFEGWVFLLYLNGTLLFPVGAHATVINYTPPGTLRLGRTNSDLYGPQFYGHIDDVAVFNKAMSGPEIASLMKDGIPSTNLVAAYTFDVLSGGAILPAKFRRPKTPNSRAFHVVISQPRNNTVDSALFDSPLLVSPSSVARRLPFPAGQVWRVIQEFDARGGSHNGYAAFSWDFVRVGAPTTQDPVIASSPGKVVYADDGVNGAIRVQVLADQEYSVYMHTKAGSFEQLVFDPSGLLWWPNPTQSWTWIAVKQDQKLVKLDPGANHLHFANNNAAPGNPDARSIPAAFFDYEVSKDQGATWQWVWRGMPRAGQYVRRTH